METCHTPEDFQYYFSVFAKPIRFDDVKDRAFLEAMFRTMLINPLVVCLDAVVDMKGLPSGVQGTAQMNTLKMFQVCNALDNFL